MLSDFAFFSASAFSLAAFKRSAFAFLAAAMLSDFAFFSASAFNLAAFKLSAFAFLAATDLTSDALALSATAFFKDQEALFVFGNEITKYLPLERLTGFLSL